MPALELTPAQRKEHRAGAHHLHPVVQVGADGLTPAVVKEIDGALKAHGLIKVRVFSDDRLAREALLADIADRLGAAPIQHIGKLLVLWRPQPDKSTAADERADRKPGPRVIKLVKFSKSGNHRATVKKIKVLGNERITAGGLLKRAKTRASSVKKKVQD
jgi:RNA-binding protein